MKALFSEFSFGFGYTFELATLWNRYLIKAPGLPSLIDEGKPGGGYDVKLERPGIVYCAQFKLSERMERLSASEAQLGYGLPYFRFSIYGEQRSNQHELLLGLEAEGLLVEYVAPLFIHQIDLDSCFRGRDLRRKVIRVKPSVIGRLPDAGDHRVVCDESGGIRMLYSEPVKLESPSDWGEITEDGFEFCRVGEAVKAVKADRDDYSNAATSTIGARLEIFTEQVMHALNVPLAGFEDLGLDTVGQARAVARTLLGAELLILSDEAGSSQETAP